MPVRSTLPVMIASVGIVGLAGVSAALILQACALQIPILRDLTGCKPQTQLVAQEQLSVSKAAGLELERRIFQLERELAALQCVKAPPDATGPLHDEGWNEADLEMLYGCWSLDTTYRTRDVDSGEIRTYRDWQMCFDTNGNGKQVMRSNDGITCEGPVQAQFAQGQLNLIEPGNLACQDNGYIHQRQISCALAENGKASCETLQPETGGEATVGFERAPA